MQKWALLLFWVMSSCVFPVELAVDCSKAAGEIRALHGVNSGPLNCGGTVDLSKEFREIGVPLTRLHDCHWPNPDVVDIHTIFPDFKADPLRPESYTFDRTDEYIQAIVKVGSGIVFRLGESIEHTPTKYFVKPPADAAKWAEICIGIIRHYNEGWADGFKYEIRHWEIWNEPENRPAMWTGNDADYLKLYGVASKAIKKRFPNLLIGGPAVGSPGGTKNGIFKPTPFIEAFLDYCKKESAPLDFFSWHRYAAEPHAFAERAKEIRAMLDQRGFTQTASHLNEWNYLPGEDWSPFGHAGQGAAREKCLAQIGGAPGAAFTAYALLSLQDSTLNVANYYSADIQGFGMFNEYGGCKKPYYVFKAFKMLMETPLRVQASGGVTNRLAICAGVARDKTSATVMIAHFKSTGDAVKLSVANLPWEGATFCEKYVIDEGRDLSLVWSGPLPADGFDLSNAKPPSVCLIKLRKSDAVK